MAYSDALRGQQQQQQQVGCGWCTYLVRRDLRSCHEADVEVRLSTWLGGYRGRAQRGYVRPCLLRALLVRSNSSSRVYQRKTLL
jgi:hypothetical protein